ncbi:MAG: flavodoxin family protein [Pseudomonadota bacterium]
MSHIAVIYHSGYGHTEKLAQYIVKGIEKTEGATVTLLSAEDAIQDIAKLAECDAMIFGTPTYMGSMTAKFKEFMEASSRIWMQQGWKDKLAAGFTNSGSLSGDKLNTLIQLSVFAAQHGMIWIGQGEPCGSPKGDPANANAVNRMGSALGAMAQSENDSPEVTPPAGDLETAEKLGERVATIALRFKAA